MNDDWGNKVEDPKGIVEILNKQFKHVFEEDNGDIPSMENHSKEYSNYNWGNLNEISLEIILSKLKKLNEHKAVGVDKVNNAVLKMQLMRSLNH